MTELFKDLALYEAVLGQPARVTTDAAALVTALQAGETGLPVEIPGQDGAPTRHLVLAGIEGDSIRYAESTDPPGPPQDDPGWLTMSVDELRQLLAAPGAAALLFGD